MQLRALLVDDERNNLENLKFLLENDCSGVEVAGMAQNGQLAREWLQQNNYCICVNENAWEHHFHADNFLLIKTINEREFEDILLSKHFVKIATNISLQQWSDAPVFIEKTFTELAALLKCH